MQRREFLRKAATITVIIPAAKLLEACGSSTTSDTTSGPAPTSTSPTLTFTSTNVQGHVHTVQILVSDINAPPANGIQPTTSNDNGHTHTVALTMQELQSIAGGGTVTKTTSIDQSHVHDFTFRQ